MKKLQKDFIYADQIWDISRYNIQNTRYLAKDRDKNRSFNTLQPTKTNLFFKTHTLSLFKGDFVETKKIKPKYSYYNSLDGRYPAFYTIF